MNKEELVKQYADKKVVKKGQYIECDFDVRKELTIFDGYDIEQAFEDGFDKAMELAYDFIGSIRRIDDNIIEDFKKYMEEEV